MSRGLPENRRKWVCQAGFSLLTTTAGVATDFVVSGGKASSLYFGVAMRPEHNHTHGQPLPLKSGFLSLYSSLNMTPGANEIKFVAKDGCYEVHESTRDKSDTDMRCISFFFRNITIKPEKNDNY
jgi:hypothetical protein